MIKKLAIALLSTAALLAIHGEGVKQSGWTTTTNAEAALMALAPRPNFTVTVLDQNSGTIHYTITNQSGVLVFDGGPGFFSGEDIVFTSWVGGTFWLTHAGTDYVQFAEQDYNDNSQLAIYTANITFSTDATLGLYRTNTPLPLLLPETQFVLTNTNSLYVHRSTSSGYIGAILGISSQPASLEFSGTGLTIINDINNEAIFAADQINSCIREGASRGDGFYSHSEGDGSYAGSYTSHAEGENTTASDEASHAEGDNTTASGAFSHAEGWGTTASGTFSHAAGQLSSATNDNTYVWSDGTIQGSSTTQTYTVYASNGIRLLGGSTTVSGIALANGMTGISTTFTIWTNALFTHGFIEQVTNGIIVGKVTF